MSRDSILHLINVYASLVLAFLLFTPSAGAWGRLGHQIVANTAQEMLTSRAGLAVHDLLGPGVSLADISTWADEQRRTGAWHYVNVPITESRYDPRFCSSAGCVVSKIDIFKRVLMDPKAARAKKQQALKYLVHLVGDLHQPLHVGENHDRGGNQVQVRFFTRGSNLHKVWDSEMPERFIEAIWMLDRINSTGNEKLIQDWSKGTPEEWATESLKAAKIAYRVPVTNFQIRSGAKLGYTYSLVAMPVIQQQLEKAAIRLAGMLNEIFR